MSDQRASKSGHAPNPARGFGACCPSCEYDLSGTPAEERRRCSECGQSLTAAALAVAREQSFFRRLRRGVLLVLLILPLAAVAAIAGAGDSSVYVAPLLVLLVAPIAPVLLAAYCSRRLPED